MARKSHVVVVYREGAVPSLPFPLVECSDGVQLELEGVA